MSQRLLVTNKLYYDAIIDFNMQEKEIEAELVKWTYSGDGFFVKPWIIYIDDIYGYKKIEGKIKDIINKSGHKYPKDIWKFYIKDHVLEHPNQKQLNAVLEMES